MIVENLYYNILLKSRNIELYKKYKIHDNLNNKIILLLIHFSFIFNKIKNYNREQNQKIFDYIFLKIETDLREFGLGDILINKKMKIIINKFYSILVEFDNFLLKKIKYKSKLFFKFINSNNRQDLKLSKLVKYFDIFSKRIDLISIDDIYNAKF